MILLVGTLTAALAAAEFAVVSMALIIALWTIGMTVTAKLRGRATGDLDRRRDSRATRALRATPVERPNARLALGVRCLSIFP